MLRERGVFRVHERAGERASVSLVLEGERSDMMRNLSCGTEAPLGGSRLRLLPLAAGAAVTLGSLANSALGQTATTATWVGVAGGSWNGASNWRDNSNTPNFPISGDTTALTFYAGNLSAAFTATNNISTPFHVNHLTFNSFMNGAITVNGTPGYALQMAGANPTITLAGNNFSDNTMSATGADIQLAGDTTINGTGTGNLSIAGVISDDSPSNHRALIIAGGNPVRHLRGVILSGANTFSGGLTLDGGTVWGSLSNAACLGAAGTTLYVSPRGGAITGPSTSPGVSLGAIQIDGDLHLIGNGGLTFGTAGNMTQLQGAGSLRLETWGANFGCVGNSGDGSAHPYTGAVVIDVSEMAQSGTTGPGTLTLGSIAGQNATPNGSLNMAASFDVRAGGTLKLDNSLANSAQNDNRIGDSTPVRLRNGFFILNGPAAAGGSGYNPSPLLENIGELSSAGSSTVTVSNGTASVTTTLHADHLARMERGTFLFRGTSIGDGTTANRGRITLNTFDSSALVGGGGVSIPVTPAKNISILPYATGGTSAFDTGSTFVTYDADGFRPLNTGTEFDLDPANLLPADPTNNVKLTAAATAANPVTMNSLLIAPASPTDASVSGSGTLTITSGAIMAAQNGTTPTISNNINFDKVDPNDNTRHLPVEGIIYTPGQGGLSIAGNMTGTGGLTKASISSNSLSNALILTGDNRGLAGQLTIDSGVVQFNSENALGGNNNPNNGPLDPILANGSNVGLSTVNGNAVGLYYTGSSGLTINRPITVNSGFLTLRLLDVTLTTQTNIGNLTLASPITGTGNVNFQAQKSSTSVTTPGEIFITNTGNNYTGITRFGLGTIHISDDRNAGAGGGWNFGGGTLSVEGDVTNSRHINFAGTLSTIQVAAGHTMTLNGPVTCFTESSGAFSSSTVAFTKIGAGTLNLTSLANNLQGNVTVGAGTLLINGNLGASTASAGLAVNAAATLGGSGTIYRNTTINAGGTLSPGNSPGILTIWGTLTLSGAATMNMQLNGPAAGSGYDQVVQIVQNGTSTASTVLGTTATLNLSLGFAPAHGSVFWLIRNENMLGTANSTTGAFAGLPQGATVPLGVFGGVTYTGTISYTGDYPTNNPSAGSGNDVVIYNVHGCGTADFNCDGDVGTDADIESFFACLAGTCPPPPCAGSADFNADGDVGTDADIEAFFRVLGGGSC
jgi:autotransporter-associated beta strand protein